MKALVLQSFRTADVPAWMSSCMHSVQQWASHNQFDYRFIDDVFFSRAPDWMRRRCAGNLYALTDVCRLLWLTDILDEGYECAIWADADMLIFAPNELTIPASIGSIFAGELFMRAGQKSYDKINYGISNAFMAFTREGLVLNVYLDACIRQLKKSQPAVLPRTALGPQMLKELAKTESLRTLDSIALFTLPLMRDIAKGGGRGLSAYLRHSAATPKAANLCHFVRNTLQEHERWKFDQIYKAATARLLADAGSIFREISPCDA